jgi:hypothetical protein
LLGICEFLTPVFPELPDSQANCIFTPSAVSAVVKVETKDGNFKNTKARNSVQHYVRLPDGLLSSLGLCRRAQGRAFNGLFFCLEGTNPAYVESNRANSNGYWSWFQCIDSPTGFDLHNGRHRLLYAAGYSRQEYLCPEIAISNGLAALAHDAQFRRNGIAPESKHAH